MDTSQNYSKTCIWVQNITPKELFNFIDQKKLDWTSVFATVDGVALRQDSIFMGVFKKLFDKYNFTSTDLAVTLEHLMLCNKEKDEKNFLRIYKKHINSKDLAECYKYVSDNKF